METKINNSVVATDNSTISNAIIKSDNKETTQNSNIGNSVIAQNGSQITNVSIEIAREKRKSFWNGFSIGGIIMSVVASAIWYIIQKYFIG
jgi:hypothetical protein